MIRTEILEQWTVEQSIDLYGIDNWGAGYFGVSEKGEVTVTPEGRQKTPPAPSASLVDIVSGLKDRGLKLPVLLRFPDIINSRITLLNESFARAIRDAGYHAPYRGVYPIKVNQQQQVIEQIVAFGRPFHHGLEAGSKAELIAVLAYMDDPEALIICNGYKDEEFVDLALYALKMGLKAMLVIELPGELPLILERAAQMGVRPRLGVRAKLSSRAGGHWNDSGGDRGLFGLNASQIIDIVDVLREKKMLDCLEVLHYHLGSQIHNIRHIRSGVCEAAHIYVSLAREGAKMGYLDIGGGLAVDYDGSHTNFANSSNYSVDEYAADIVEELMKVTDEAGVEHPTIISESGRALVAHHSVLIFNILGVTRFESHGLPEELPADIHESIKTLVEVGRGVTLKNIQESYHDAVYYRDEVRELFEHGMITLRERALAERYFRDIITRIAKEIKGHKYVPDDIENLDAALADIYHGNFSVFQSLPDVWAIEQIFPVMPLHRLNSCPTRQGTLSDITCDCDGKINRFVDLKDVSSTLRLHEYTGGDYYLGVFLTGAYQETLGDLHNLFGDTNVVGVRIGPNGEIQYQQECSGDTVADVLSYVEYNPQALIQRVRNTAERAVSSGLITAQERRDIMQAYVNGLQGYTYFE